MQCQNDKVVNVVECPQSWDPYLSLGDNLTHLPQVFDGHACQIPEFCTNVESDDPLVMVPVHEFTKHVRNWNFQSDLMQSPGSNAKEINENVLRYFPGNIFIPNDLNQNMPAVVPFLKWSYHLIRSLF
ncbi:uncharacterized protein TNCV_1162851 [Trichonephila clavipes]|nr:uncharacterized protein TNCV_1162851 [Trichonephila clavipes]